MIFLDYGQDVITIPAEAVKCGAGICEMRLLILLCSGKAFREASIGTLSELLSVSEEETEKALDFWEEKGIISRGEEKKTKKAAPRELLPSYSGLELEKVLEKEKALAKAIDECQKITGNIFTPTEAGKVAAMNGELGLSPEHIMLMFCYYAEKMKSDGKRLTVAYIEKTAYALYNDGIDTLDKFEKYVKEQEEYQSITGRIRRLFGIGDRAFTKTEKNYLAKWIKEWEMPFELIALAFDITVDATGKTAYPYMSKIMSGWHDKGIKTEEEAEKEAEFFRSKEKGDGVVTPSFDTREFFDRALKRSYEAMKKVTESEDKG